MLISLGMSMVASADQDCRGEGSDQKHEWLGHRRILWDWFAGGLELKVGCRDASVRYCDSLALGHQRRVDGDGQVVRSWRHPYHVGTVSSRGDCRGFSRVPFSDDLCPRKRAEVSVHVVPVHGTLDHGHRRV